MADKNWLKIEKLPFWTIFKAMRDRFLQELGNSTAKYKKNTFKYAVCHDKSHHLLKYLFGICLCSM